MSINSWRGRRAWFRTVLVALVVAAGIATRPAQAVPALFTGLVTLPGQPSAHAIPGMPDAMFVAGDFTVETFENTYQVAETFAGDMTHQLDFSLMDTVAHATITTPTNSPAFTDAITLSSDSTEPEANDTGVWSFSFSLPETLGEATPADGSETAPAGAGHDKQVSMWADGIKPGPGSAFLALGAVAVVAVFRWREGLRG
jgi:hypothetical protein